SDSYSPCITPLESSLLDYFDAIVWMGLPFTKLSQVVNRSGADELDGLAHGCGARHIREVLFGKPIVFRLEFPLHRRLLHGERVVVMRDGVAELSEGRAQARLWQVLRGGEVPESAHALFVLAATAQQNPPAAADQQQDAFDLHGRSLPQLDG